MMFDFISVPQQTNIKNEVKNVGSDRFLLSKAEEVIQKRINEILSSNDQVNFDKLPGLIESLKIIKEL
jgi:hypothetical protein